MSELKQETLDLSASIGKDLSLEDDGIIKAKDGLYERHLPEGIQMDQLERIQAHNTEFIAATAHAVGTLGIDAMQKDPALKKVTAEIATVGRDTISVAFERSRQVRASAPTSGDNTMKTKHGITTIDVDTYGAGPRGEVQMVKTFLSDRAAELLK